MKRAKKHIVHLSPSERATLTQFVSRDAHKARAINRARILLLADAGKTDRDITDALGVCRATISSLRKKYTEKGDTPVLELVHEARRSGRPIKVDSQVEAQITMIACSEPPEGTAKWTLRRIADRLIRLEVIDTVSHETVRRTLKKTT
jgi:transposase